MATTYEKVDENTIKSIEQISESKENTYSYDFLVEQRARIETQKLQEIAQRDKELAEIDRLISESEKLGIVSTKILEEVIK